MRRFYLSLVLLLGISLFFVCRWQQEKTTFQSNLLTAGIPNSDSNPAYQIQKSDLEFLVKNGALKKELADQLNQTL